MADFRALRPVLPILLGAALMLSLSLGIRQSLGLLAPQLTRDLAISMSDFTLAIADPESRLGSAAGRRRRDGGEARLPPADGRRRRALCHRPCLPRHRAGPHLGHHRRRPLHGRCDVLHGVGAGELRRLARGAGACAQIMLGIVTAVGSLGAMIAAPIGQGLTQAFGWRGGAIGFVMLGARHDPGCVVRQPRRQDPAAGRGQPRDRQRERPPGAARRCASTCRSW